MLDWEIDSVMEEHFPCLGMLLLTIAQRHLYVFSFLLERHTVAAVRLEHHILRKFHVFLCFMMSYDYRER